MITPFHLGTAAYLHHTFGSKMLIEYFAAAGITVPYHEVRRLLTSTSINALREVVPTQLVPLYQGGRIIQEGDDNVDILNCTIDGKNTFHAMARVNFQHKNS